MSPFVQRIHNCEVFVIIDRQVGLGASASLRIVHNWMDLFIFVDDVVLRQDCWGSPVYAYINSKLWGLFAVEYIKEGRTGVNAYAIRIKE